MAEGRRLSDDSMERLRKAVRFLRPTGNSHRPIKEKHPAGGKCPRDFCYTRAMGAVVHHSRFTSDSARTRRSTGADSALVRCLKEVETARNERLRPSDFASLGIGIKAKRDVADREQIFHFASLGIGIKAKRHCLIERIRLMPNSGFEGRG